MRSIVFRFEDFAAFALALQDSPASELPAPPNEVGPDGEWVLSIFEVGERRRATAAAGRVSVREGKRFIVFEERDWDRLVTFSLARSGHFRALRGSATSSSNFPVLSADDTSPPQSFRESAPPVSSSRIPPSRVLVIDDDTTTREVVTKTLEALSLTVVSVLTVADADASLASTSFDIVVLDFGLPRGSGLDFVRRLRKQAQTATLPVLFVSEQTTSRDAVEAFASGADDFVTKPLRASELSARIIGLLRRARASQPPERSK